MTIRRKRLKKKSDRIPIIQHNFTSYMYRAGNSYIVNIEINVWSRYFLNIQNNLILTLFNIPHGIRTQSGVEESFTQERDN